MLKGYKVVGCWNDVTGVMQSSSEESRATVEYEFNKSTTPKKDFGPLAVFTTLRSARDYIAWMNEDGLKAFPCDYIKSQKEYMFNGNYTVRLDQIDLHGIDLSKNTDLADVVILRKEVK